MALWCVCSQDAPPARLIPAGRCLQSLWLQSNRCLIAQQATPTFVCVTLRRSGCEAGEPLSLPPQIHPAKINQPLPRATLHLLFSSLGLKSAYPSLVQQTAISACMEHAARSEGCRCSNWYVWENKIDGGDGERRKRRRQQRVSESGANVQNRIKRCRLRPVGVRAREGQLSQSPQIFAQPNNLKQRPLKAGR